MSRLQTVSEREIEDPNQAVQATAQTADTQLATKMLMMALQALGQRFVVALANMFTLLTAASAFYLWLIALPILDPTKIIGLTIYSGFVLCLNIYGRRK